MSKLNPENYNIPGEYQHWEGDPAEDHIGPFFFKMIGENPQSAFRLEPRHCNAHNTVHGGILMTFADYTLCLGANRGTQVDLVTVSCNNEFIAPASVGDLVTGHGEVVRRGGSLVFMRCLIKVGSKNILSSSGVIKLLR